VTGNRKRIVGSVLCIVLASATFCLAVVKDCIGAYGGLLALVTVFLAWAQHTLEEPW
jgi:hypothetical protein